MVNIVQSAQHRASNHPAAVQVSPRGKNEWDAQVPARVGGRSALEDHQHPAERQQREYLRAHVVGLRKRANRGKDDQQIARASIHGLPGERNPDTGKRSEHGGHPENDEAGAATG
jgi:hypothetical protein